MNIRNWKLGKKQKQEADEFYQLFAKHQDTLYRVAFIYVRNKEDALDVMQETAYRAFRSFHTNREPQYIQSWLTKITIHCSLDLLRKKKRIFPADVQQMSESESIDLGTVDDFIIHMTLEQVIEELDEMEKSVVLLRYYQDFKFQKTAEALDIPLGTAKTILYRALQKNETIDEGGTTRMRQEQIHFLKEDIERIEIPSELSTRVQEGFDQAQAERNVRTRKRKGWTLAVSSIAALILLSMWYGNDTFALNVKGYFTDIVNRKGAVIGTIYEQATRDIK